MRQGRASRKCAAEIAGTVRSVGTGRRIIGMIKSFTAFSVLAITLVPVLMILFIRGRMRPESRNPLSRFTQALYLPVLRLCLRYRKTTLLLNLLFSNETQPTPQLVS